jgi:ribosomal protein S27AE
MSDSNVIDLQACKDAKKREYCFQCPCGNQLFVLRPDARIECGHCGEIQNRLLWGQYFTSPSGAIDATPIPSG